MHIRFCSVIGIIGLAVAATGTRAGAAVIENFEPGTTYAGSGTIEADPTDASNQVLFLNNSQLATFATPTTAGTVTMRVYDFGGAVPATSSTSVYGPRWGVSDGTGNTSASAAIAIINKSFLGDTAGYGMQGTDLTKTGSWFSPQFFGGPRQVTTLDDGTTAGNEGVGKWATWTFLVNADGTVKISGTGIGGSKTSGSLAGTQSVTAMSTIWAYGGTANASAQMPGVLIDDINFVPAEVPEPASIGLLGIGLLATLRRRRVPAS